MRTTHPPFFIEGWNACIKEQWGLHPYLAFAVVPRLYALNISSIP
jgi:hypothetical protein